MKKILLLTCAGLMTVTSAAVAGSPAGVTISADRKTVYADHGVRAYTPPHHTSKSLVIFSNLASLDRLGVYMAGTGFTLGGPNSPVGQFWQAAAFTPTTNSTITEVQAAIGYVEGARPTVLVSIYSDAAGLPGTLLWSHKAKLPAFGDCCDLAVARNAAGLPVTSGTQYWVTVTTLPGDSDLFGAWSFNVADQVNPGLTAVNSGSGWIASPSVPNLAFAIYGN